MTFVFGAQEAHFPTVTVAVNETQGRRTAPILTDGQREAAIGLAASQMQHYMEQWERYGVFSDHAAAVVCKERMYELIKGRSPAQVKKMEQERGLS